MSRRPDIRLPGNFVILTSVSQIHSHYDSFILEIFCIDFVCSASIKVWATFLAGSPRWSPTLITSSFKWRVVKTDFRTIFRERLMILRFVFVYFWLVFLQWVTLLHCNIGFRNWSEMNIFSHFFNIYRSSLGSMLVNDQVKIIQIHETLWLISTIADFLYL